MRGKTAKKLRKFVQLLVLNTPKDKQTKSSKQLFKETKILWYQKKGAKQFVNKVVSGELFAE